MVFPAHLDAQATWSLVSLVPHVPLGWAAFLFVTRAGGSFVIWLLVLLVLIVWRRKKEYLHAVYFSVSAAVSAGLTDIILKNIFERPRPFTVWSVPSAFCPHDFSFPSGHATFSFAAATILADLDRKRAFLYYMLAILISYSRLYLYCHYLGDVAAGAFIGSLISLIVLRSGKRLTARQGSRPRKPSK